MFNEEENLTSSFSKIVSELATNNILNYEIIFVNDGSTDNTWEKAKELALENDKLKVVGYNANQGRGKAIRTGIDNANGDIICTIDFDLSYDPPHITRMIKKLENSQLTDAVLTSCYMPGGNTIGIPPFRLFISKMANLLYRFAFTPQIYTSTCVVRAYRKDAIKYLDLESDDKEIHLEIISKLLANNFKIKEIPGTLTKRKIGKSSFKFAATSISHLTFFLQQKPIFIFGFTGVLFLILAFFSSSLFLYGRFVNPDFLLSNFGRFFSPNFVIILFLGGLNMLGLGLIGIQNSAQKKEILKIQKKLNEQESNNKH